MALTRYDWKFYAIIIFADFIVTTSVTSRGEKDSMSGFTVDPAIKPSYVELTAIHLSTSTVKPKIDRFVDSWVFISNLFAGILCYRHLTRHVEPDKEAFFPSKSDGCRGRYFARFWPDSSHRGASGYFQYLCKQIKIYFHFLTVLTDFSQLKLKAKHLCWLVFSLFSKFRKESEIVCSILTVYQKEVIRPSTSWVWMAILLKWHENADYPGKRKKKLAEVRTRIFTWFLLYPSSVKSKRMTTTGCKLRSIWLGTPIEIILLFILLQQSRYYTLTVYLHDFYFIHLQ